MLLIPETGVLKTDYSKDTSIICGKGKGRKRAFEIMASLTLLGPSTTSEVGEFVLKSNYYQNKPERKNTLRDEYSRIIKNRFEGKTGKKKTGKIFPGLVENHYVIQTGTKIVVKTKTPMYFLTLKGCFFVLGFDLNDEQLLLFIKNAARNHLFFNFLKLVHEKISLEFVKDVFLFPIKDLIERKRIVLDDEMYLNFGIVADTIGITLYEKRKFLFVEVKNFWNDPRFKQIEELRKMIIYDQNPREYWYESVVEFFYNNDDSLDFYDEFSENRFEMSLFNKVMYQLLHGYHEAVPEDIPMKSGFVLPRSKRI